MGTTVGLRPGSRVYDRDTDTYSTFGGLSDIEQSLSVFPDYAAEMIADAQAQDYINSLLEEQLTPEQVEAQRLGLSVEQYNAKTEDMLDSIINIQGATESGLAAAESILKGKIAQAGVTDPAAQEAALKSGMESIKAGGSGIEAVKAAAAGAKDFVEGVVKKAKDVVDAGYDKVAAALPEGALPDTVGIDPTTGQTTAVWGKASGTPVMGGTVGTVGGGTYAGVTTTGDPVVDAVIKVINSGGDLNSVIEAATGLPPEVVDAAVGGAGAVAKKAAEVLPLDQEDDGRTDVVLTPSAGGGDAVDTVLGDGVTTTTGEEPIDPNSANQTLTVGDGADAVDTVLGDGVTTTTGEEAIDPTSTNQTLTVGDGLDPVDTVLGGNKWEDTGAGGYDEVISGRVIGDGFDAGAGPDDKVLEEVVGPRITGDPFTFTPILDEEEPPVADEEVPPILDEVPPEPPPEVPEVSTPQQGYRVVQVKPGELAEFGPMFDISGSSIFPEDVAPEQDAVDYLYPILGRNDIVQNYDIEELIKFLASGRG